MDGSIKRKVIVFLSVFIVLLLIFNYSCVIFSNSINKNDITNLKFGYLENFGEKHYYCYMGISDFCECNPDQYVDFLENLSLKIVDTSRCGIQIYYINYNENNKNEINFIKNCSPYKLEEDYGEYLILNQIWSKNGKLDWQHWYISDLEYKNKYFDKIREGDYNYDSIQVKSN